MTNRSYSFDFTPLQKSIIKVIGVGGGGSNAVNFMYNQGIRDVDFIVCNTDNQALQHSPVPVKLQIGEGINKGLGAGGNPAKGKESALESKDKIKELLNDGANMLFITAGMGGGTGSGAAPVIAQIARELGMLTVGIVTMPFRFEGRNKMLIAEQSLKEMRAYCDAVIEVSNDKIREMYPDLEFTKAFANADMVLATAAKSISELITRPAYINVDFEDVKSVMANSGHAVMGSAFASGTGRAMAAIENALNCPLLNSHDISGAQKILISIISGNDPCCSISEITDICEYVQEKAGFNADLKCGSSIDPELGDSIRVTVIVTGFEVHNNSEPAFKPESQKIMVEMPKASPMPNVQQPQPTQIPLQKEVVQNVVHNPVTPVFNQPESLIQTVVTAATPQAEQADKIREQPVIQPNIQEVAPGKEARQEKKDPEPISYLDLSGQSLISYSSPEEVERPLINIDAMLAQNNLDEKNLSTKEKLRTISDRVEFDADTIKQYEIPTYMRLKNKSQQQAESYHSQRPGRYVITNENEIVQSNRYLNDRPD